VAPARLSLARTAKQLLDSPRNGPAGAELTDTAEPEGHRVSLGEVSLIAPPGTLDGVALSWSHGPHPLGDDPPRWS
jgi:hypothetical protein